MDGETRSYDLEFKQDIVTIGRHSGNDVQIPDMHVSSQHARILEEDGTPVLFDLASRAGTPGSVWKRSATRSLPRSWSIAW